jgi:broad specificity phosphatase PhoE
MTGRLILVMHAESTMNAARVMDSRPPGPPLSETGVEQAEALAERLASHNIEAVRSSTAVRAMRTAEVIADRHGLKAEAFSELLEVDCGDLEGRGDPDAVRLFERSFGEWVAGERDKRLPGGESWNVVAARMMAAVPRFDTPSGGDVVVVGHAASLRILVASLVDLEAAGAVGFLANGMSMVLTPRSTGGWTLSEHDSSVSPIDTYLSGRA